ncbi:MAG: hypothetical protein P8008_07595 [Gammaproteobacteria bacterium]
MTKFLATLCSALLLLAASAQAQQGFSTVEERMTGKEFTAAGLDKLTPEELAALNEWLRAHSVATLENATQPVGDQRGFEVEAMKEFDESDIVARVQGPFTGWSGQTVFKLDNGMIWEQVEAGTFYIPQVDDPVVVIEQGMFNAWRLRVEGYNKTVRVRRVQ